MCVGVGFVRNQKSLKDGKLNVGLLRNKANC